MIWRRAAALLLVLLLVGGTSSAARTSGPVKAVATTTVLADFVAAVGGPHVRVEPIVRVGGDPHVYAPGPSDARRVTDAHIVFCNGLGLERWLNKLIGVSQDVKSVITLTHGLRPVVQRHGAYTGYPNPHMWMDPTLAEWYVEQVRDALVSLDPVHTADYERNARAYLDQLSELDHWIAAQISTIPRQRRRLVTTHDGFRYFGDRYDVDIAGTIWSISTERAPSAKDVQGLIEAVRREGVPTVFVETTVSPTLMERVAREAGAKLGDVLFADSVGAPGSGTATYLGMMRANARAIVHGLGGSK